MSEGAALTPDIVQQLLEADIANIVALVQAGQPLTKAQRARLAEHARKKPASTAAPAPIAGEAPPVPSFALTSEPSADPEPAPVPGEYREKLAVYAERYGYGLRAVKLWISEGKAAQPIPRPPPLDDPEAMLPWWTEVKKNRVPPRLFAAAETARRMKVGTGEAPKQMSEGTGAGAAGNVGTGVGAVTPPAPKILAVGFAASLERVRVAEAEANARYLEEFGKPESERDEAKVQRLRREWSELSEQLRFLEKAAPEVLSKTGEMLTKAEVRRILAQMHGPIVSGVRTLFRRTRSKAPANATLDDLERIYSAEVERLFGDLLASDFAPA